VKINPREIENADFHKDLMAAADLLKEDKSTPNTRKSRFLAGIKRHA
jgi:hypothetical protein